MIPEGGEVDDMIGSTRYKVQGQKVVILLLFMYSVLLHDLIFLSFCLDSYLPQVDGRRKMEDGR